MNKETLTKLFTATALTVLMSACNDSSPSISDDVGTNNGQPHTIDDNPKFIDNSGDGYTKISELSNNPQRYAEVETIINNAAIGTNNTVEGSCIFADKLNHLANYRSRDPSELTISVSEGILISSARYMIGSDVTKEVLKDIADSDWVVCYARTYDEEAYGYAYLNQRVVIVDASRHEDINTAIIEADSIYDFQMDQENNSQFNSFSIILSEELNHGWNFKNLKNFALRMQDHTKGSYAKTVRYSEWMAKGLVSASAVQLSNNGNNTMLMTLIDSGDYPMIALDVENDLSSGKTIYKAVDNAIDSFESSCDTDGYEAECLSYEAYDESAKETHALYYPHDGEFEVDDDSLTAAFGLIPGDDYPGYEWLADGSAIIPNEVETASVRSKTRSVDSSRTADTVKTDPIDVTKFNIRSM